MFSGIRLHEFPETPRKAVKHREQSVDSATLNRKVSEASFKSANSQTSTELSTLIENYAMYLENCTIQQEVPGKPAFLEIGDIGKWVEWSHRKVLKRTDGVGGLRLSLKNTQTTRRSLSNISDANFFEQKFIENYAKNPNALYVRGQVAESVEVRTTALVKNSSLNVFV